MTFGFRLINDDGNISVDETNPVYALIPSDTIGRFVGAAAIDINYGNLIQSTTPGRAFGTGINFQLDFWATINTVSPPLLFARPSSKVGLDAYTMIGGYRVIGSPGAWTGIGFFLCTDGPVPAGAGPAQVYETYRSTCCDFAIAVPGGYFQGGYGLRLADTAGKLMFDSNNKHIALTRQYPAGTLESYTFGDEGYISSITKTTWIIGLGSNEWVNVSTGIGRNYPAAAPLMAGAINVVLPPAGISRMVGFGFTVSPRAGGERPDGNNRWWPKDNNVYKTLIRAETEIINFPPYPGA